MPTPAQNQRKLTLQSELQRLIRSNGVGGLTRAADSRAFELLVIDELFTDIPISFDSGPGDPSAAAGNLGDYWLNETTGWLWRKGIPFVTDSWVKRLMLKGAASTVQGPKGDQGDQGNQGNDGRNAYQVAVSNGFVGNVTQWLLSLHGADGPSAYQVAVASGFSGTAAQWLASLKGAASTVQGPKGDKGDQGKTGDKGRVGEPGASAYQIAVDAGYSGSVAEWLASLHGATPPRLLPPMQADPASSDGSVGDQVVNVASGDYFEKTVSGWVKRGNIKGPAGDGGTGGGSASPYILPAATDTVRGGIRVAAGSGLKVVAGDQLALDGGSLPSGGAQGQVLTKSSATDGDATWQTPAVTAITSGNQAGTTLNFSQKYQLRAAGAGNVVLNTFTNVALDAQVRLDLTSMAPGDQLVIGGYTVTGELNTFQVPINVNGANATCTFYDTGGPFVGNVKNILRIQVVGTNVFELRLIPLV